MCHPRPSPRFAPITATNTRRPAGGATSSVTFHNTLVSVSFWFPNALRGRSTCLAPASCPASSRPASLTIVPRPRSRSLPNTCFNSLPLLSPYTRRPSPPQAELHLTHYPSTTPTPPLSSYSLPPFLLLLKPLLPLCFGLFPLHSLP